ncbi:MAG: DUF4838 domain-containing protein [Planctomycetales bacterium]|nr:DUF4838 domain-containing protein [Planctomycetales bacterium]
MNSRRKMRFWLTFVLVVVVGMACCDRAAAELTLAEGGQSSFVIVVPEQASPSTRYGAEELQLFLRQMTGAELPIESDRSPVGAHEIVLGRNAHLKEIGVDIDFDALGAEGYRIATTGNRLVIAGSDLRGTLYGVYGLLEDHLGCRWFTPTVSRIPKHDLLVLADIDETTVPALEYREPFVMDCYDGDWCARNRMNSSAGRLEARHGGKVRFGTGLFVHSFNVLMPPEKYFDAHPEYYSEVNGKRVKDRSQLCCTNPDVIRICTEELANRMRQDPEAFVYSLSQNDWANYCECANCSALAEREGSQMGPLLHLVNTAAEALEREFPGKAIETLAYQWSRTPPRTMRPRKNVIIRLCSIECCFMHPLATCSAETNRQFVRDLNGWSKVADRLWVWDYVTSFGHYLSPFPNLRVRDDNIRLLVANHVTGIFEQDVYNTVNGELSPLSGYLNAKLLWDPDYDEDTAINEFLEGVYGAAARPIRRYLDLLHDKVEKENIHARIWVGPRTVEYLTDDVMAEAGRLWDEAEAAVSDSPETLERVRIARLSYDYAVLEKQRGAGGLGEFVVDHKAFMAKSRPEYVQQVKRFFETARRAGVTRMNEGRMSLDQYEAGFAATLAGKNLTFMPVAAVADVDVKPGLICKYYEGQWESLPNFSVLAPAKTEIVDSVDLKPSERESNFALEFTGYVKVPRDGLYTFCTNSNDGSQLFIGDELVADNGGLHAAETRGGFIALKAGLHPIRVSYFQEGGTATLSVLYEGPGIDRQVIPLSALSHSGTGAAP